MPDGLPTVRRVRLADGSCARVPEEVVALLGTMPDAELAQRLGRSREWVTRVRCALQVPPDYGRAARAAEAEALAPLVRAARSEGVRTRDLSDGLGTSVYRVRRLAGGVLAAPTWTSLERLLLEAGPLTSGEIRERWGRGDPHRYLGGYVSSGYLVRQADGRYALTGRRPRGAAPP